MTEEELKGLRKSEFTNAMNAAGIDKYSFLDIEDRGQYIRFLKIMYNSNIPWSEFYEHKDGNIEKIDKKINKIMKDDLYKDKEILLDRL